jgi:hypothetical protein
MQQVAPHQFGRMTCGRARDTADRLTAAARARKPWPHVLSPAGRGVRYGRVIFVTPPMYGTSASGMATEPSACW